MEKASSKFVIQDYAAQQEFNLSGINAILVLKLIASTINQGFSIIKGIGNIGEALIDTGATLVAIGTTPIAGLSDLVDYIRGNKKETSAVKDLWNGTKSFVAKDWVNGLYKKFYTETKYGKLLDDNAFSPFKSTGAVTGITSGLGELAGTAAIAAFTGGTSMANPATATKTFTLLRGLTGAGRAMQ